ncbi:MAG: signal peptidase II, partial [Chloroflexi bacterium]|nr:signal peptidase II [Chloroflexota bacterium]
IMIFLAIAAFPIYLFYTQTRRQNLWIRLAFVGIVSASLGHLLGDISQPYTTDFIQVFRSPSANLADIYSYVGIGALIIEMYQVNRTNKPRGKGIRGFLAEMVATRKEFIQFIKKRFKSSNEN